MSLHVFTSEAVSEGHPDKVADQISDAILDAALARDPEAHVAAETFVGPNFCANLGELKFAGSDSVDYEAIARGVVRDIGYDRPGEDFSWDTFVYLNKLTSQSPDIDQGVSRGSDEAQGAGDQGMMFGYAVRETPELMPAPLVLAHRLMRRFARERKGGGVPWLRPDAKSQVSAVYDGHRVLRVADVVLSHQTEEIPIGTIRATIEEIARDELRDTGLVDGKTRFHINPTGRFVKGGPAGDSGLTGRKIIVDSYGGAAAHGGGAFSGKDPSKVDRSAAYYARYAAKNLVAAGAAERVQIEVSYAIGLAEPTSLFVEFFGTGRVREEDAARVLLEGGLFDFRPGMLVRELGLKRPSGWCYRDTSNGGHFGRRRFPWERLDKADALREALRLPPPSA